MAQYSAPAHSHCLWSLHLITAVHLSFSRPVSHRLSGPAFDAAPAPEPLSSPLWPPPLSLMCQNCRAHCGSWGAPSGSCRVPQISPVPGPVTLFLTAISLIPLLCGHPDRDTADLLFQVFMNPVFPLLLGGRSRCFSPSLAPSDRGPEDSPLSQPQPPPGSQGPEGDRKGEAGMEEEGAWPLPREPQTDLPVAASSMGCLRAMLTLSCTDSTWVPLSCGRRGERTGTAE